jgi:hypothetical protein
VNLLGGAIAAFIVVDAVVHIAFNTLDMLAIARRIFIHFESQLLSPFSICAKRSNMFA